MKHPQATLVKKQLSEAFIARPKNLVRSFGMLKGVNSAAISASSPLITGVGLGQLSPDEYYVRLLANGPVNDSDAARILKTFKLSAEEVKIVPVGHIQFQNLPIRDRRRPASPGASIGHHGTTAGTLGCIVHKGGSFIYSVTTMCWLIPTRQRLATPSYSPARWMTEAAITT